MNNDLLQQQKNNKRRTQKELTKFDNLLGVYVFCVLIVGFILKSFIVGAVLALPITYIIYIKFLKEEDSESSSLPNGGNVLLSNNVGNSNKKEIKNNGHSTSKYTTNKSRSNKAPMLRRSDLTIFLGKSILSGNQGYLSLFNATHIGIYGESGSGKTSLAHSILYDIVATYSHREIEIAIVDPKIFKYKPFSRTPHLKWPIASEDNISRLLRAVSKELQDRLNLMNELPPLEFCEGIGDYNKIIKKLGLDLPKLKTLIVVVDEVQEVVKDSDCEEIITRIAKVGREVGIKLICSTQRPTAEVPHSIQSQLKIKFIGNMVSTTEYNSAKVPPEIFNEMKNSPGIFSHKGIDGKWDILKIKRVNKKTMAQLLQTVSAGIEPQIWESTGEEHDKIISNEWSGSKANKRKLFKQYLLDFKIGNDNNVELPTVIEIEQYFNVSTPTARTAINMYYELCVKEILEDFKSYGR